MTTITSGFDIDSHWSDILWDQLLDVDELFADTSNLLAQQMNDENEISIDDQCVETAALSTVRIFFQWHSVDICHFLLDGSRSININEVTTVDTNRST